MKARWRCSPAGRGSISGQYQPDQVLKYLHTNAIQSAVEAFSTADPNRQWTVQALADWAGIGGFGPLVVGSAQNRGGRTAVLGRRDGRRWL